jgi:hypothetical protein
MTARFPSSPPAGSLIDPACLWATLPRALREEVLHVLVALATELLSTQRHRPAEKGRSHGRVPLRQNH